MGLFSVCEEGEFRGSSNPSPLGKNDMLVINEGSNCSGVLDRNSKMVPTSAIFSDREILEVKKKVVWSLEEEITKVIEKGMALGFEFNGKKKVLLEIITIRKKENDNRFHELVCKLKPSVS
ncbi:hypothetical protein LWI28_009772 [Acer negundo]|uniref:Uncharacterized protein n=1 Tax=Acer negundo TaxID=4023 RepID=A0AAD5NF47_ACENE|nr:hypothetical protein LWI28_009772 [Acer negundo]